MDKCYFIVAWNISDQILRGPYAALTDAEAAAKDDKDLQAQDQIAIIGPLPCVMFKPIVNNPDAGKM